mgnify:CR=1 FL=1
MKKNLFVLILLCAMSVIQVNAGENPAVRREYDFTSFNAIRTVSDGQTVSGRGRFVSTNYKISLVKSDHYKVIMEVWDRDDIDLFEIRQAGSALELVKKMKKYPYRSSNVSIPTATITIYTPEFPSVTLSGNSQMSVSGGAFSGENLVVNLSGITKLDGLSGTWDKATITMSGSAKIGNLSLTSGSCHITCSGVAEIGGISSINSDKVVLSMSGTSKISLENFRSESINATASGVSKFKTLEVNAGELCATLSGTSSFSFSGEIRKVSADMQGATSLSLKGTGNELAVSGSGTAVVNAEKFTVKDASLNLSGVSGASVTVTEKLETETSGNSHIDYYDRPKSVINKSSNVVSH